MFQTIQTDLYGNPILSTCHHCGKKYYKTHHKQKYCSDKCRTIAHREQQKQSYLQKYKPTPISKTTKCRYCGKTYIKTHNRQQYCTPQCKTYALQDQKAQYQQKRRKQIREGYLITNENEYIGTGYLSIHPQPTTEKEYNAIQKEMIRLHLKPKIY